MVSFIAANWLAVLIGVVTITLGEIFIRHLNHRFKQIILLLLLIVLPTTACLSSNSSADGNEMITSTSELVEVDQILYEVSIVVAIRLAVVDTDSDTLFGLLTSYEIQPDVINLWGTYTRSDGSGAPGTASFLYSIEDGKLVTTITAVDVEGLDVDHPRVINFNKALADSITNKISENEIVEIQRFELVGSNIEVTYLTTKE